MTTNPPADAVKVGAITWACSDEDSGPDVGMSICIGENREIWAGEVSKRLWAEGGIAVAHLGSDNGWWLTLNTPDGIEIIGKCCDVDSGIKLIETLAAPFAAQASQIEALMAEDVYQAKLLLDVRNKIILFASEIEDEGDRVYFGSTNHADYLRELEDELDEFDWSRMEKNAEGRDFYAELRALRQEVEAADARATAAEAKAAKMREALTNSENTLAGVLVSMDPSDRKTALMGVLLALRATLEGTDK